MYIIAYRNIFKHSQRYLGHHPRLPVLASLEVWRRCWDCSASTFAYVVLKVHELSQTYVSPGPVISASTLPHAGLETIVR